jgi:hypothetical protein
MMADSYITIGATGMKKKVVDLGDGTFADAAFLVGGSYDTATLVPAKAAGSTGGLGKIANLANTEVIYVRVDASDIPYGTVDWSISASQKHDIQFYKAHSIVDSVTLTLASFSDTNTMILNGLTYTGESTAGDVEWSKREFKCGGTDTADAAALAAIINADYSVLTAGTSVAATDKLIIVTDEGTFNIVAAAAADYPGGKYKLDATAATERASIVLAINHRDTITVGQDTTALTSDTTPTETAQDYALADELATDHNTHTALTTVHKAATAAVSFTAATTEETLVAEANAVRTAMAAHYASTAAHNAADATNLALVNATTAATDASTARTLITALVAPFEAHIATAKVQAGDTFTVNGLTFTGHASTTDASKREFKVDEATASDTADELVTLLDDATYGVEDTTSVNASGAIGITRDTADVTITITAAPAAASVHSCITIDEAGGVPGVLAAANGTTAELSITPVWTETLTVTEAGNRLTVTDIDAPGIKAAAAEDVVTLTPGTAGGDAELATVIQATAAANCTVAQTATLLGLSVDGAAQADVAANNTTAGKLYEQDTHGWEYLYAGITNDSGGAAATVVVGATLRT